MSQPEDKKQRMACTVLVMTPVFLKVDVFLTVADCTPLSQWTCLFRWKKSSENGRTRKIFQVVKQEIHCSGNTLSASRGLVVLQATNTLTKQGHKIKKHLVCEREYNNCLKKVGRHSVAAEV